MDKGCADPSLHCEDWEAGGPCCWCGLLKELDDDKLATEGEVPPRSESQ